MRGHFWVEIMNKNTKRINQYKFSIIYIAFFLTLLCPIKSQAQTLNGGFEANGLTQDITEMFFLIAGLGLLPSLLLICTSFPFYLVIFSILRQGMGLQQAPPNMLLVALALFLTYLNMEPVISEVLLRFSEIGSQGAEEFLKEFMYLFEPLKQFMESRADFSLFSSHFDDANSNSIKYLIPAFLTSELARAFQVAFALLIPFLIIDLAVAAILMAVGMMMVPPSIISLPVKIGFFIAIDGWSTLVVNLA